MVLKKFFNFYLIYFFLILLVSSSVVAQGILSQDAIRQAYEKDKEKQQQQPSQQLPVNDIVIIKKNDTSKSSEDVSQAQQQFSFSLQILTAESSDLKNSSSLGLAFYYQMKANENFWNLKPKIGLSYQMYNYSYQSSAVVSDQLKMQYKIANLDFAAVYQKKFLQSDWIFFASPALQFHLMQECQAAGSINSETVSSCKIVKKSYFNVGLVTGIQNESINSNYNYGVNIGGYFGAVADAVKNPIFLELSIGYRF